jgi:hypothetical protein
MPKLGSSLIQVGLQIAEEDPIRTRSATKITTSQSGTTALCTCIANWDETVAHAAR